MGIIRTSEPAAWPIGYDDFAKHMFFDGAENDDPQRAEKSQTAIRAAIDWCEHETGRALAQAEYQLTLCLWPCDLIMIDACPVRSVAAVSYYNEAGAITTLPEDRYLLEVYANKAALVYVDGWSAPALQSVGRNDLIIVDFVAGYDDPAESGSGDDPYYKLPYLIRAAALMKAEAIYETGSLDAEQLANIDRACQELLFKQKIIR